MKGTHYMKRSVRNISAILSAVLLIALLAACGSSSNYRDDVPAADIATSVDAVLANGADMKEYSETYITGSMGMDVNEFSEYSVKAASKGATVDEYGIFKGADASSAKQIEASVKEYLKMRVDTFMSEYMPEELPKIENAEVKVCGSYVMYAILSDDERAAAFEAFETALAK